MMNARKGDLFVPMDLWSGWARCGGLHCATCWSNGGSALLATRQHSTI